MILGDFELSNDAHTCSRNKTELELSQIATERFDDTFPAEFWTPAWAAQISVSQPYTNVLRSIHAFTQKKNPAANFNDPLPADFRGKWTTIDEVEEAIGNLPRVDAPSRFFMFQGTTMVALWYMLFPNNACTLGLIVPAQSENVDISPFLLSAGAWQMSSMLVPVFFPCECIRKK